MTGPVSLSKCVKGCLQLVCVCVCVCVLESVCVCVCVSVLGLVCLVGGVSISDLRVSLLKDVCVCANLV